MLDSLLVQAYPTTVPVRDHIFLDIIWSAAIRCEANDD